MVASEVNVDLTFNATFPKFNDVSNQANGNRLPVVGRLNHSVNRFVDGVRNLRQPTLLMPLVSSVRVGFSDDASRTCDGGSLGLSARHAAESTGDEGHTGKVSIIVEPQMKTGSVEQGNGGAVDNTLGADVHVGTSRHLAVLRYAKSIHSFVILLARMVWNHHAVGYHHSRRIGMRRKQAQWMARIHDERLVICHFAEVLHHETILRPILEHCSVSAVSDEFVWKLCNSGVEIVVNHEHDGCRLR